MMSNMFVFTVFTVLLLGKCEPFELSKYINRYFLHPLGEIQVSSSQWRSQRFFLAGASVGLNYPVMVLRDEHLSWFYVPDPDCRRGRSVFRGFTSPFQIVIDGGGPLYWRSALYSKLYRGS